MGIRQAHEAMMLQDAQELLKSQREQTKNHQASMLGMTDPNSSSSLTEEGDAMGIRVGDEIHYYQQPPAPLSSPSGVGTQGSGLSTLAKVGLVGAGLALGGPAAGLATYLATKPAPQPVVEERPDFVGGTGLMPPIPNP